MIVARAAKARAVRTRNVNAAWQKRLNLRQAGGARRSYGTSYVELRRQSPTDRLLVSLGEGKYRRHTTTLYTSVPDNSSLNTFILNLGVTRIKRETETRTCENFGDDRMNRQLARVHENKILLRNYFNFFVTAQENAPVQFASLLYTKIFFYVIDYIIHIYVICI